MGRMSHRNLAIFLLRQPARKCLSFFFQHKLYCTWGQTVILYSGEKLKCILSVRFLASRIFTSTIRHSDRSNDFSFSLQSSVASFFQPTRLPIHWVNLLSIGTAGWSQARSRYNCCMWWIWLRFCIGQRHSETGKTVILRQC